MPKVVFVTGNSNKAQYFSRMMGADIDHVAVNLDEVQSLSLKEIVEHKARQSYEKLQRPVLVEDTKLAFAALGGLPGPFIKWFLDTMSTADICKMLDGLDDRSAVAGAAIAYYDGKVLEIFERELAGTVPLEPKGSPGFGWNPIFIPKGSSQTLGEMTEAAFEDWYKRIKPFDACMEFLRQNDYL